MMYIEGLDALDNKILDVIKDNARLTFSEIGERVGLSRVAVKNRMETMERNGIIRGYRTEISPTRMPSGIQFVIDVETFPESYGDVLDALAAEKYLRQIYSTTGECRIHAVGFAPNPKTLESRVNYLYRNTKGIRRMGWHILLSTFKDVDGGVDYEPEMRTDF